MRRVVSILALMGLFVCFSAEICAAKRVALVIGNSQYEHTPSLKNPANDAADVSATLKRLGFEVITGLDLKSEDFVLILVDFYNRLKGADVGLLYYAGHGIQFDGKNFLVPVDAKLKYEIMVEREAFNALDIIKRMEAEARLNLIFLDACRDNPLADQLRKNLRPSGRSASIGRGLARIPSSAGETLLVYAAAPGTQAQDGKGRNSPFTKSFLENVETPGLEVEVMLKRVTKDVRQQTNERQRPERLSKLTIEFYFNENKLRVTTENEAIREETSRETTGAIRSSEAMEVWTVIKETRDKEILKAYIDRYSETFYATLAKRRIAKLEEAERKTVVTPSPNKTVNTPAAPKIKLPSSQPISANCKVSLESWRTKASIGAFALSKEGACGWSWRHKTESDARNAAMEYCKKYGTECKVIDVHTDQPGDYSLTNECRTKLTEWHKKSSLAAFAVSRDGACGWSFNYDTMQGAEKRALKECANQGPECKVIQTR